MIQGRLDRLHLGDLMQWITLGALSGRLALGAGARERRLDFLAGRVVFASSSVPHERLATWLAREGVFDADELRHSLGLALLQRRLFTDVLLDRGADVAVLQHSIGRLAADLASRTLAAGVLDFRFDPAYPVEDLLTVQLHLDPNTLLMEAARRTDESPGPPPGDPPPVLPFQGPEFDDLFWQVIRSSVPDSEPLDGEALHRINLTIRGVVRALSQWLRSSSGLVPIPERQSRAIAREVARHDAVGLGGRAHATWNQLVLRCAVLEDEVPRNWTLEDVASTSPEADLWPAMVESDTWVRPDSGRLDQVTADSAAAWSDAAAAAAEVFGVPAGRARLAVHLAAVPTDMVLWALSSLQLGHRGIRAALLDTLPRRLGAGLASLASFPDDIQGLFSDQEISPLSAALVLARETLPTASLWLAVGTPDPSELFGRFPSDQISAAAEAARDACHAT